jgi:hypothetical protein
LRVTRYCSGVNCDRQSASVFVTLSTIDVAPVNGGRSPPTL